MYRTELSVVSSLRGACACSSRIRQLYKYFCRIILRAADASKAYIIQHCASIFGIFRKRVLPPPPPPPPPTVPPLFLRPTLFRSSRSFRCRTRATTNGTKHYAPDYWTGYSRYSDTAGSERQGHRLFRVDAKITTKQNKQQKSRNSAAV